MSTRSARSILLVEGKNDQHVIWALCERHRIQETFAVEEIGGIDRLLEDIPVRLKADHYELPALGIVVDADQDLQSRWDAVLHQIAQAGYQNLPARPEANGLIVSQGNKPKVGVWLMPDNQLPGMLENFVAHLIPEDDLLTPKLETCLEEIEQSGLNRYKPVHRPKAFIHAWLACQDEPGRPMGQAITAHVLNHDKPIAAAFVNWLNRLFVPSRD